jgi:5'-phosphate synthase pdxT subunit
VREVRVAEDLVGLDAMVLPGGESTTMLKLLAHDPRLEAALADWLASGQPTLATCAGMILLATGISPKQRSFAVLDLDVVRNGWGRQVHSAVEELDVMPGALPGTTSMEGVLIRAPRITRLGPGIEVLVRFRGEPVTVQSGSTIAATFHPELGSDTRLHLALLELASS